MKRRPALRRESDAGTSTAHAAAISFVHRQSSEIYIQMICKKATKATEEFAKSSKNEVHLATATTYSAGVALSP